MRYAALLILPAVLGAQPAQPDGRLTEALITEVRQLRLAVERSMVLSARVQLAVTQLQLEEATVARLAREHSEVRSGSAVVTTRRAQLAEKVSDLEAKRAASDPAGGLYDMQIRQTKFELGEATAADQERSARESELTSQLSEARSRMADSLNRVRELERALAREMDQLLKQK